MSDADEHYRLNRLPGDSRQKKLPEDEEIKFSKELIQKTAAMIPDLLESLGINAWELKLLLFLKSKEGSASFNDICINFGSLSIHQKMGIIKGLEKKGYIQLIGQNRLELIILTQTGENILGGGK